MVARVATLTAALAALAQAVPQVSDVKISGNVVTVNPKQQYQYWDGTGVSEAFQRGRTVRLLDTKSSNLALDLLFSNQTGAGVTIVRNGIGSSSEEGWDHMESIEPVAPRSNSSTPHYVSLDSLRGDQAQIWFTQQAIARGVKMVYADAWSADPYMKTNNNTNYGGYICGVTNATCATGDWRQAYANKLVKYIEDYQNNHGITIDYVGFLNEPDQTTPYASMNSDGQQAADFIEVLHPTLQAAGLKTQIACCDGSGWKQAEERLWGIQAAGAEDLLGVVTGHGYSDLPTYAFNTTRKVWETEWSTFDSRNLNWYTPEPAGGFPAGTYPPQSDGLTWANHAHTTIAQANVSAFFYWWGAANDTDNEPLIYTYTNSSDDSVIVTKRLWAMAHWGSRLVLPGAYRIDATANNAMLNVTAFSNPDGTTAVQVINNANITQAITIKGLTVPNHANAVNTFTTNQNKDFDQSPPLTQDKNLITQMIPAFSLTSFKIASS